MYKQKWNIFKWDNFKLKWEKKLDLGILWGKIQQGSTWS